MHRLPFVLQADHSVVSFKGAILEVDHVIVGRHDQGVAHHVIFTGLWDLCIDSCGCHEDMSSWKTRFLFSW